VDTRSLDTCVPRTRTFPSGSPQRCGERLTDRSLQ
jgi:hypothetical protein